jgi:peptidoglycan/LPS O-acetylase OafA/YrhL
MDGLRGLLALYVMLGHALPLTSLPGWAAAPFRHGEAAVDLFFALSGLVMVPSLAKCQGAFRPFMAARARRLLPVYFIALALSMALLAAGDPLRAMPWVGVGGRAIIAPGLPPHLLWHLAAHLLLLQGVIPQGVLPYAYVTLLGPAWSLATEWQFYLLLGALAPRRIGRFALALLALGAAYHLLRLPPGWQFSRAFLPDAAPYFALGLASAARLQGGGRRVFALCLLGACGLGCLAGADKAATPLLWALALLAQYRTFGAVLEMPTLQYLGAISYPLYLINEPVQRGLALLLAPRLPDGAAFTACFLPLATLAPLLAAALLHHAVERPFMRQQKKTLLPVIAPAVPQ